MYSNNFSVHKKSHVYSGKYKELCRYLLKEVGVNPNKLSNTFI